MMCGLRAALAAAARQDWDRTERTADKRCDPEPWRGKQAPSNDTATSDTGTWYSCKGDTDDEVFFDASATQCNGETLAALDVQNLRICFNKIVDNDYDLSINRYKEVQYEAVQYDSPKVILERLAELEGEITKGRAELEGMLR